MLTDEQVERFRSLYRQRFGVDLDEETARKEGYKILQLVRLSLPAKQRPETD